MSKTKEILARAEKMRLIREKTDILSIIMDIEGAIESHDFCGIIENVKRDSYPPKDFGLFVPRFARIKEGHKA